MLQKYRLKVYFHLPVYGSGFVNIGKKKAWWDYSLSTDFSESGPGTREQEPQSLWQPSQKAGLSGAFITRLRKYLRMRYRA